MEEEKESGESSNSRFLLYLADLARNEAGPHTEGTCISFNYTMSQQRAHHRSAQFDVAAFSELS